MNKLVIPALLTATIMVAGIFAFIPVNEAATVHATIIAALSGANEVRVIIPIADNEYSCGETCFEYSGEIRIEKHTPGFFQVEKLYLCDAEVQDVTWVWYMGAVNNTAHTEDTSDFDVSGVLSDDTSLVPDLANIRGPSILSNALFGNFFDLEFGMEEGCVDLLTTANFFGLQGQPFVRLAGEGPEGSGEDVAVFLFENSERSSEDEDGAYLLAYVKGQNLSSTENGEDIWIMHTTLETILETSVYDRGDLESSFGSFVLELGEATTSVLGE